MTMNTRLHIAEPVNPETLFFALVDRLESEPGFTPAWEDADPSYPFIPTPGPLSRGRATYKHVLKGDLMFRRDGSPYCHATTGEQFIEDDSEYQTTLGQGLGAIVEVTYAMDGPLRWPDYGPHETHLVSANFDTAYGMKFPNGAGCSDLHALLLRDAHEHLTAIGVTEWSWRHEEKGTWHGPTEWSLRGDADRAAANFPERARR